MEITVVIDKNTKKVVPFNVQTDGQIIITASGNYKEENLIVTRVDPKRINWFSGYLIVEEDNE